MKKINALFLVMSIAVLALSSCSNDQEIINERDQKYVQFSGSIENSLTKAQATTWDSGDAIGVYMKNASGFVSGAENVKYTTAGDGAFSAATTGIEFPADGSNVDFIAYYPYQTTIVDYTYPINVANQTNLPTIDLLYSKNATNINKTSPTVGLNFKHQLSQLILNISAGSGVSLSGLTISVSDLVTDGSFNLTTGVVTKGSTKTTLAPNVTVTGGTASSHAILVPGEDIKNAKITFVAGGKNWILDGTKLTSLILESGKKYTYTIDLTLDGVIVINPNAVIDDWIEGNTGGSGIILTPNEDPKFEVNTTTVSLPATGVLTETIALNTLTAEAWTAASSDLTWLTLSPTSGTGSGNITVTAMANTGAARSATITLTPTTASLSPITITVSQAAGGTTVVENLLFPGSDFEDWSAFLGCLYQPTTPPSLKAYAVQNLTSGRNGSSALHLNGTPTANDYVFTAILNENITVTPTKIVFFIKGTSTGKSLSLNIYKPNGTNYEVFNLGNYTAETVLVKANSNGSTGNGTNSYTGAINTGGNWMKVTLNLSGVDISKTSGQNVFALKAGTSGVYDLLIDDISFE